MTKDEALKLALEALENNKQMHYYCEDTWYSCPQHEEGCANDSVGDECNCGADKANAEIDKVITAIKEALAQPEQEPVTVEDNSQQWKGMDGAIAFHLIERHADNLDDIRKMMGEWLSANTPQRTWVGLTNNDLQPIAEEYRILFGSWVHDFARAIEAKLKEKNT